MKLNSKVAFLFIQVILILGLGAIAANALDTLFEYRELKQLKSRGIK